MPKNRLANAKEIRGAIDERERENHEMDSSSFKSSGRNVGRIFLPSTVTGTWSYWKQACLDCQALVAKFGAPTLFITATMNSRMKILERLGLDTSSVGKFDSSGRRPSVYSRPDLVARVWNQFRNDFVLDVTKHAQEYFGKACIAYCWKEEYQSRYFPHVHMLLWLEGGIFEDPAEIDHAISAELPRRENFSSEEEFQKVLSLVKKFMVHRHSSYCKVKTGGSGRSAFQV